MRYTRYLLIISSACAFCAVLAAFFIPMGAAVLPVFSSGLPCYFYHSTGIPIRCRCQLHRTMRCIFLRPPQFFRQKVPACSFGNPFECTAGGDCPCVYPVFWKKRAAEPFLSPVLSRQGFYRCLFILDGRGAARA